MHRIDRSSLLRALGVFAVAILAAAPGLAAQTGTVAGRVTDAQSGQTVAAAQVFIADQNIGALTQQSGAYILLNVPAGTHTVSVERIGYGVVTQQVTVSANETTVADFRITAQALALDELVITGTAGGQQRRSLGNSIASVSASEVVEMAPVTNMQGLLAARTPGIRFGRTDGQVGGGASMTVRGVSSVSLGSMPLIYVDGVRVDNDATLGPSTGSSQNASALNDINPDDIESIEIIKGPSAATLYGTEASAGVIQIITKKGNVGAPVFEFAITQGTNFMRNPQGILGTQYGCAVAALRCPDDQIVAVELYNEASDYMRGTGRFAGIGLGRSSDLFQNGHQQRYNMSVRGGVDQVRYYVAGTLTDEVGVVDYNTNDQMALRANVTILMGQNFNLDVSSGYTSGRTQFATIDEEGGVWHQLVWGRPQNLPGVRSPTGSGFLGFQERFPQDYENTNVYREYNRFTGSVTATHTASDWFTQRLTVGIDRSGSTDNEYIPGGANFPNAAQGYLEYGRPLTEYLTFDWSASGQYQLTEDIGTETAVGARYYSRFRESLINEGSGFPTSVQTVIDQTEFGNRQVSFSSIESKTIGFFVQEQFSWQDRIFFTAALSGDDNSAFGSNFDLQYYPNVQASWVLSEESFWNVGAINSLRLRAAWGKAGRQPGTFASQTLYSTFLGPDGNGLIPATAGNPDIGPEVSTELEAGFDIALFNDRLSGQFSVYNITTSDMLVNQSLAPSTGLTGSRSANLGEMKNRGWEASIDARLYESQSVGFDLTVAADRTRNEITSLGQDILPTANFQIGWPFPNVSSNYILRAASMNGSNTSYDPASLFCDGGVPAVAGGPNIMRGGETVPCSSYGDTGLLLGPAYPEYTVQVAPTLTLFRDVQVFAVIEGQYGKWVANVDANYACRFYRNCLKAQTRDDPMFLAGISAAGAEDDRYNGRFPADFWRMRQVGVRYSLPNDLVARLGADRAALSVSARNIWTIWQLRKTDLAGNPIYDPDYTTNTTDPSNTALWEMPGIASFSATLRVTF